MMMTPDLGQSLTRWPYDPDHNVRLARGDDGRQIIVVRQPNGLEQYEADGHPQGPLRRAAEAVLDSHRARLYATVPKAAGRTEALTAEHCAELVAQALAYYDRLTVLFRLKDWRRAERDAAQILRLIEFIGQHAQRAVGCELLAPWRPQISRLHRIAGALTLFESRQYWEAVLAASTVVDVPVSGQEAALHHERIVQSLLDGVRDSLTSRPALQRPTECLFVHEGDFWTLRYQGESAILKSSRGLQCLACLLREPGREMHVSELVGGLPKTPHATAHSNEGGFETGLDGIGGVLPLLDVQAKAEYKRRLNELREETEEAEGLNDPDRAARAQQEQNAIVQHIASAVGLGGRDRSTSSAAERARCAVTKRIKQAVQKVGQAIPSLGQHLSATVRTGYFCCYDPQLERPVAWKVQADNRAGGGKRDGLPSVSFRV